jgi:hypothetical protein
MGYRLLVTGILVVHFAFLAYVVFGGLPAIRWPKAFWPHLVAATWGLLIVTVGMTCPLTAAEDWARQRAGEGALSRGFIDRYIEGVLYPARYTNALRVLVALVIVGSWLLAYRRYIGRIRAGAAKKTRSSVWTKR